MFLAGDIGGTKTLLGLFSPADGPRRPLDETSFPTRADHSPGAMVRTFLADRQVDGAVLGVAGAVLEGAALGSNLPWPVRAAEIATAIDAPAKLINDLEAIASWVPELRDEERIVLQERPADPDGRIGIVAPGTGLGEAMLVPVDGRYHPVPSEAGHIDFAPADELQAGWWRWLHERHGHVSLERACSGGALPVLLDYLVGSGEAVADPDCQREIAAAGDPTPFIVAAGLEQRCAASTLALATFADMLAAAAGNLALQVVATGGIYLGGGLPPRILPLLRAPRWRQRFRDKGRFAELMERVPVWVIADDRAALLGAARQALSARV